MIQSGTTLYGMASNIFSFNTTSNTANLLYAFGGRPDGSGPHGSLTQIGNTLFGLCTGGGAFGGVGSSGGGAGGGTIFSYNLTSNTETVLHSFSGKPDGNAPDGSLVQSGSVLYGMTSGGGNFGNGSIFSYDTVSGTYSSLFSFDGSDGGLPLGDLLVDGPMLFGMTSGGDARGKVFSFNTVTNTETVLHYFDGTDGSEPNGDLTLIGNKLFGMTRQGGTNNDGVIFSIVIPEPATVSLISAIAATALLRRPRRLLA